MTPEVRFVILCVREMEGSARRSLASAAAAVRDWDLVASLSDQHRVTGYVENAIREQELKVADGVRPRLRRQLMETAARAMMLDSQLSSAVGALSAAGVGVIVLKGPALARTLYSDPRLRPYGDIDLVIRAADQDAAVRALLDQGYVETSFPNDVAWTTRTAQIPNAAGFHRQFQAPQSGVLELHFDTLQLGLQPRCESGRWERALPLPGILHALALSSDDQIVTLALHAHKHGYTRLLWLKDLDLLLRTGLLNWPLAVQVAESEGIGPSLWYSLCLASQLLGTPIPAGLLEQLRPRLALRLLYRAIWPSGSIANLDRKPHRRAVQLVAAESWRGILPNLVLMRRRRDRARAAVDFLRLRHSRR